MQLRPLAVIVNVLNRKCSMGAKIRGTSIAENMQEVPFLLTLSFCVANPSHPSCRKAQVVYTAICPRHNQSPPMQKPFIDARSLARLQPPVYEADISIIV